MATQEKIRIRLKAYDHTLIDQAAEKIVEAAKRNGAKVSGPIPLPTDKEVVTILRAVHKYKDSREQFEFRTHKRLIDILKPSQKAIEALVDIELPAGVESENKNALLPQAAKALEVNTKAPTSIPRRSQDLKSSHVGCSPRGLQIFGKIQGSQPITKEEKT